MKKIGDILAPGVADMQISNSDPGDIGKSLSMDAKHAVDNLFEILRLHCRNFDYVLAHHVDPEFGKREWVRTFMQHNMTLERVNRGIRKIRDKGYGHMIYPVEFIKMTIPEPEEMGAPPIHDAFAEASKNAVRDGMEKKWSHKAVRYAYNKTSSWSLSHEPAHVIKPVFESFYLQGCLLAFEGKILDQIEIESPQDKYDRDRKKQIAAMSPYARSAKDHLDAIRRALK